MINCKTQAFIIYYTCLLTHRLWRNWRFISKQMNHTIQGITSPPEQMLDKKQTKTIHFVRVRVCSNTN